MTAKKKPVKKKTVQKKATRKKATRIAKCLGRGRPTKYTPELLAKANEYIENWRQFGDHIPMIESLALHCGISKETCYAWAADDDKAIFSDVITRIKGQQARELLNKGLSGEFNPVITKLVLGKHDYSDKRETDLKNNGGTLILTVASSVPDPLPKPEDA